MGFRGLALAALLTAGCTGSAGPDHRPREAHAPRHAAAAPRAVDRASLTAAAPLPPEVPPAAVLSDAWGPAELPEIPLPAPGSGPDGTGDVDRGLEDAPVPLDGTLLLPGDIRFEAGDASRLYGPPAYAYDVACDASPHDDGAFEDPAWLPPAAGGTHFETAPESEEIWYGDVIAESPALVPGTLIVIGAPTLYLDGHRGRCRGRVPVVVAAPSFHPLAPPCGEPADAVKGPAYDPCWDPCRDPRFGSWEAVPRVRPPHPAPAAHRRPDRRPPVTGPAAHPPVPPPLAPPTVGPPAGGAAPTTGLRPAPASRVRTGPPTSLSGAAAPARDVPVAVAAAPQRHILAARVPAPEKRPAEPSSAPRLAPRDVDPVSPTPVADRRRVADAPPAPREPEIRAEPRPERDRAQRRAAEDREPVRPTPPAADGAAGRRHRQEEAPEPRGRARGDDAASPPPPRGGEGRAAPRPPAPPHARDDPRPAARGRDRTPPPAPEPPPPPPPRRGGKKGK